MPESLGKILKRTRESNHLSIEEVSERSRIPKHIISTLEEDRLNEIRSVFYAKSFVKTYAVFLGALDEPGIKEYLAKSGQPPTILKPAAVPISGTAQQKSLPAKEMPQLGFSCIIKYKNQIIAIIIGVFAFWVLSSAISHVTKFIKNISVKKQNKIVKSARKGTEQATRQRSERKPLKEKKEEAVAVKTDEIEIEVSTSDNTWLRIIGDGELMFTGTFRKGSSDTWKAKREIKLEAGNSGVIKISVNGKPANFSGKKGEKKEIIITKDGIK